MPKFSLLASLLLYFVATRAEEASYHRCNHDNEEFNPGLLDVDDFSSVKDDRSLATAPNIRIYPHYDTLQGGTSAFTSYLRYDLIPPVLDFYRAALRVRYPLTTPLKLSSSVTSICSHSVPSILQTTGVDADHFVFFIIDSGTTNIVATSQFCYLSLSIKRPIISRVKFNTGGLKLPNGDPLKHEDNIYVLMHEMMHSFGFSSSLFPYFVDDSGVQRKNHIKQVTLLGSTRQVLDVPVVTNRARKHFGCPTLPGIYLENNGDSTLTAGSHLERKHFLLDVMTSGMLHGRRLSELSLAVLEGSGWYYPDYNYADPNSWGAGQGCDFFNTKCSNVRQFDEFCVKDKERGCFASGMGGGSCKSDTNADGCKIYSATLLWDCENPNAAQQTRLSSLQTFGRGVRSRCFEGTLSTLNNDKQNTFCFKYDCTGSGANTELAVQVGSHRVICHQKGSVQVEGYAGNIKCPDPLEFCQNAGKIYCPRNCLGRGTCVNGKCKCNQGYKGVDCGLRI